MNSKTNWLFDASSHYVTIQRGYRATISINVSGTATLAVTYIGPTAKGDNAPVSAPVSPPSNTAYSSIKLAKQAFRVFLRNVPVTA